MVRNEVGMTTEHCSFMTLHREGFGCELKLKPNGKFDNRHNTTKD